MLINIGRAAIVDEEALYEALRDNRLGGAALDVWWQHWSPEHPERRGSRLPFHELPNVLMTPHCSGFTEGTADRRWGDLAANLDRYRAGRELTNVLTPKLSSSCEAGTHFRASAKWPGLRRDGRMGIMADDIAFCRRPGCSSCTAPRNCRRSRS